eukprot:g5171.t1
MNSELENEHENDANALTSVGIELTTTLDQHSKIEDEPDSSEIPSPRDASVSTFNVECGEDQSLRSDKLSPRLLSKRDPRIQSILLRHFLPIGFLVVFGIAILCPLPGRELGSIRVGEFGVFQTLCVCVIFLISGLCFKTSDVTGLSHFAVGLVYGVISILLMSPSIGFAVMKLNDIPRHYRIGLSIFLAMPTTLTMGIALVDQAGGNTALALLLIISSNLLGILTVPFSVKLVLGSQSDASIDAIQLLLKLLLSILTPLVIGKGLLEASSKIQKLVSRTKRTLGLISNGACLAIVWVSLSKSRKELMEQRVTHILTLLLLCCCIHLILLIMNYTFCSILKVPGREKMAVVILTSQKTFPVALAVISYLDPEQVGELGLLTIPCVVAQMNQLFTDSVVLSKWKYERNI